MIFLVTVAAMIATVWQQRRAERMAAVRPEDEPAPPGLPGRPVAERATA
jgi:hypothetical protein